MKDSFVDLGNTMLLKDRVYKTLKTEIILGHFKAGQRLNMLELANSMNISSAPIREALNMLCKDGFVILNPRKQAIVAESSLDGWRVLTDLRRMLELCGLLSHQFRHRYSTSANHAITPTRTDEPMP